GGAAGRKPTVPSPRRPIARLPVSDSDDKDWSLEPFRFPDSQPAKDEDSAPAEPEERPVSPSREKPSRPAREPRPPKASRPPKEPKRRREPRGTVDRGGFDWAAFRAGLARLKWLW